MRLTTYSFSSKEGIGSISGDEIIPFSQDSSLPTDMLSF